ncbi:DNA-processing protein DprA [Halomonas sp. SCS19]|uniref:DNA-processing protein DprA n=1 Tax=Halomonas sp. SCS19 TaxID=2950870 RepID=UPI0032DFC607
MELGFARWMALNALPQVGPRRLARLRQLNPDWPGGWLARLPPGAAAELRLWLDHPRRSPLTALIEQAEAWLAGEAGELHASQASQGSQAAQDGSKERSAANGGRLHERAEARHLLHPDHPRWPALLDQIPDPPVLLWALGDLDALVPPRLALVGSRRPTREGLVNARSFAVALAEAGWCLVSGMALGIDGAAQAAALDLGGRSIAVLAGGVDVVYPGQHGALYRRLRDDGGLLLAESPPGTRPRSGDFPRRNRIVTGLSCGVLVVEAAEHSGSLVSARLAGEQGREVLALPGSIHSPQARGCLRLIREGAALVRHPDDLFEELACWGPRRATPQCIAAGAADGRVVRHVDGPVDSSVDNPVDSPLDSASERSTARPAPSPGRKLLDLLSATPLAVDDLMGLAGCDVAACQRELTLLEIAGQAGLVAGGWVRLDGGKG